MTEIQTLKQMVAWLERSEKETPDLSNTHYGKLKQEFLLEIEHLEHLEENGTPRT